MKRSFFYCILVLLLMSSCVTKKDVWYLQDSQEFEGSPITYSVPKLQPNDILKIDVGALIPESAVPYNNPVQQNQTNQGASTDMQKLQGYIVSENNKITFPVLGDISVENMTVNDLKLYLEKRLRDEGHLLSPTVNVRLINAKVTILGEVKTPGTYTFVEQDITIFQAIGYAGDLGIQGKRDNILFIRESDSTRQIASLDIRSGDIFNSPYYHIKPNDVIIVNPNSPKVKSAGFIGNVGTFISVFSIILSTTLLITR